MIKLENGAKSEQGIKHIQAVAVVVVVEGSGKSMWTHIHEHVLGRINQSGSSSSSSCAGQRKSSAAIVVSFKDRQHFLKNK